MLNKKGFTIAEVIVSFTMLTIILASVMAATVFYRNKVKDEEIVTKLIDFKNTITKVVYDDILSNDSRKLVSAYKCIGTPNCVNFVDKENRSHVLKIVEIEKTNDHDVKGVYLFYDNIKYFLPDSDLGEGNSRACDFATDLKLKEYDENGIYVYTVVTTFKHRDLNQEFDIMLTVDSMDETG